MSADASKNETLAKLRAHRANGAGQSIAALFDADAGRFGNYSRRLDDLLLDFSKTQLDADAMALLCDLARAANVEAWRDRMVSGEKINTTENRAVLHMALRNPVGLPFVVDGKDILPGIAAERDAVLTFAENVRDGTIRGHSGRAFTDVVNIGIGGSDLGPAMAAAALAPYRHDGPRVHFVSNVDGAHLSDVLQNRDLETTLFVIVSKTFTTQETMTNAATARQMVIDQLGAAAVEAHFAAVSSNVAKAAAFGISADRCFPMHDWVGGRYSIWSAAGLSLAIAIGAENFQRFLAGGAAMDQHFMTASLADNLPVLLALVGVWHRSICNYPMLAVVPYDQRLARLPAYLQQLDMESNGKGVQRDGEAVAGATGPIIFGEPGSNAQHAIFQLFHQGSDVVPVEFLLAAQANPDIGDHHAKLAANCLAQAQALMTGRTEDQARAVMIASGMNEADADRLAPHRTFPGNSPSVLLAYRRLDPYTLGRLVALYEHKVFVQGVIWGINSFDQFGVELGKELAGSLLPILQDGGATSDQDASTTGLIAHLAALRESDDKL